MKKRKAYPNGNAMTKHRFCRFYCWLMACWRYDRSDEPDSTKFEKDTQKNKNRRLLSIAILKKTASMHSAIALAFFSLFYRSFYSLLSVLWIVRQNKCLFLVSFINKSTRGKHYFKLTSSIMTKKEKESRAVWTGTKLSENRGENIRLSFCFLLVFLSMTNSVQSFAFRGKVPSARYCALVWHQSSLLHFIAKLYLIFTLRART